MGVWGPSSVLLRWIVVHALYFHSFFSAIFSFAVASPIEHSLWISMGNYSAGVGLWTHFSNARTVRSAQYRPGMRSIWIRYGWIRNGPLSSRSRAFHFHAIFFFSSSFDFISGIFSLLSRQSVFGFHLDVRQKKNKTKRVTKNVHTSNNVGKNYVPAAAGGAIAVTAVCFFFCCKPSCSPAPPTHLQLPRFNFQHYWIVNLQYIYLLFDDIFYI